MLGRYFPALNGLCTKYIQKCLIDINMHEVVGNPNSEWCPMILGYGVNSIEQWCLAMMSVHVSFLANLPLSHHYFFKCTC